MILTPKTERPAQDLSDEKLISLVLENGEINAFSHLYDRYKSRVYGRIVSLMGDNADSEDLLQEVFVKVYVSLKNYEGKSSFSSWVYSITYNHLVDALRKRKRFLEDPDLDVEDKAMEETKDEEVLRIDSHDLIRLMDKLEEQDKLILLLKFREEQSIKDIMKTLNIKESAAKMRIKRAKNKLIQLYQTFSHEAE